MFKKLIATFSDETQVSAKIVGIAVEAKISLSIQMNFYPKSQFARTLQRH